MSRLIVFAFLLVTTTVAMYEEDSVVQAYHVGNATDINRRYQELWNVRNFEALVKELYTKDAVFVTMNGTVHKGHDAILKVYQRKDNEPVAQITKFDIILLHIDICKHEFLVGVTTTIDAPWTAGYYAVQTIRYGKIARFVLAKQPVQPENNEY